MTINVRTHSTSEVQLPDTDIWFETAFPPDPHEDLFIRDEEGTDNKIVSWLTHDPDGHDYFEWDTLDTDPKEWVNGVLRDFRNGHDGGGQERRDAFMEEAIEAVGADRVFIVEVYSHGLESFSRVAAAKFYPDRQWDVCPACVLVVPPDVTDPAKWADGVLEQYTSWVNGDVWGVTFMTVAPDGTVLDDDSIWGFIGRKYAEETAKSGY